MSDKKQLRHAGLEVALERSQRWVGVRVLLEGDRVTILPPASRDPGDLANFLQRVVEESRS